MSSDAERDEQQEEASPLIHEDVVERLLAYQARLREGIGAEEVIDVAAAEAASGEATAHAGHTEATGPVVTIPEPKTSDVSLADLAARVARLESAVEQITSSLAGLRTQARDNAVAIDDGLAEVIERLDDTVRSAGS